MPEEFPPELNHISPRWFQQRWEKLVDWCYGNRPVAGDNVTITDAPGGGKQINVDVIGGASGQTLELYLASAGQIYLFEVVGRLKNP